eukprot:scaffold4570_cov81-Cylindrotheca_fusiformis.AAC.7
MGHRFVATSDAGHQQTSKLIARLPASGPHDRQCWVSYLVQQFSTDAASARLFTCLENRYCGLFDGYCQEYQIYSV